MVGADGRQAHGIVTYSGHVESICQGRGREVEV